MSGKTISITLSTDARNSHWPCLDSHIRRWDESTLLLPGQIGHEYAHSISNRLSSSLYLHPQTPTPYIQAPLSDVSPPIHQRPTENSSTTGIVSIQQPRRSHTPPTHASSRRVPTRLELSTDHTRKAFPLTSSVRQEAGAEDNLPLSTTLIDVTRSLPCLELATRREN